MRTRQKTSYLVIALTFCLLLINVAYSHGTVQPDTDVQIGTQLIRSKIDFLLSSFETEIERTGSTDLAINEQLIQYINKWEKIMTQPDRPIFQSVAETGRLHNSGDPVEAGQVLNQTIRQFFGLIMENEDLSSETFTVIQELLGLLGPEAYGPAGEITGAQAHNRGSSKDRADRTTEKIYNFRYYGKPYNLDTDVTKDPEGALFIGKSGNDEVPVALSPFYSENPNYAVENGPDQRIELNNGAYRDYQWEVRQIESENPDATAKISTKLVENEEKSVIVFDYYNAPVAVDSFGGELTDGIAGLSPGEGTPGEPGEGRARDFETGRDALSDPSETPISFLSSGSVPYTAVGNAGVEGYFAPITLDMLTVFRPEQWDLDNNDGPSYSVHKVSRNLVVDSESVMKAEDVILDDVVSENAIKDGFFTPDNYDPSPESDYLDGPDNPYPLQADINDLNGIIDADASRDMLNNDGLLAYYVQYEEHLMNQALVDLAENADEIKARMSVSNRSVIEEIQIWDAMMDEISDAKAGWVGKDIHGNWTRTHQAVLRKDQNSVAFLNVTHRGNDANDRAGLNSMVFTTKFAGEGYGLNQDLRNLPWSDWLGTQSINQEIASFRYIVNNYEVQLDAMAVEFTNPMGEMLTESRNFAQKEYDYNTWNFIQPIYGEKLTLNRIDGNNQSVQEIYQYDDHEYRHGVSENGFDYVLQNEQRINVSFYLVGDDPDQNRAYEGKITDIWDALRVNEAPNGPYVGDNNLEIVIDNDKTYFNKPFDVVYIPMSRMIWKDKTELPELPN